MTYHNIPERRIDPPDNEVGRCVCGHCFDDHYWDSWCMVVSCDCHGYQERTAEDARMEYGDICCDERRRT